MYFIFQGLSQIEELLIARVVAMVSVHRLPFGQYSYSGHVINFPQDITELTNVLPRLPSEVGIFILKKENATNSHREFRVRRKIVQNTLL